MFQIFKRKNKEEEIEDPPEEVKGKVEFCSPTIPYEVFRGTESIDNFIKNLNNEDNGKRS